MRGRLAAVLQEGVLRVCCCEVLLVGMSQVDIVEGEGSYGEGVGGVAQGMVQRGNLCLLATSVINPVRNATYENRLARSLNTVQPQKQWRGLVGVGCIARLVGFYAVEEERDAVLGFVVDDFGHFACCSETRVVLYGW